MPPRCKNEEELYFILLSFKEVIAPSGRAKLLAVGRFAAVTNAIAVNSKTECQRFRATRFKVRM